MHTAQCRVLPAELLASQAHLSGCPMQSALHRAACQPDSPEEWLSEVAPCSAALKTGWSSALPRACPQGEPVGLHLHCRFGLATVTPRPSSPESAARASAALMHQLGAQAAAGACLQTVKEVQLASAGRTRRSPVCTAHLLALPGTMTGLPRDHYCFQAQEPKAAEASGGFQQELFGCWLLCLAGRQPAAPALSRSNTTLTLCCCAHQKRCNLQSGVLHRGTPTSCRPAEAHLLCEVSSPTPASTRLQPLATMHA